jgi:NADPH:quinone reductase-like Zn-dependent oxidoreductase
MSVWASYFLLLKNLWGTLYKRKNTWHERQQKCFFVNGAQMKTMKALRLHRRGGPEQLVYEDAPLPEPQTGEVRVRVYAAGITPTELTWDETYQTREGRDRLPSIPGHDVSGIVDVLGSGVSGMAVGDEVYGLIDFPLNGSAAEYVAVPKSSLAPKPRTLDHNHAAAVPLSALTAWQALFDHGRLSAGQNVLIHGAAGGVGNYAVQLARWKGAKVFAICSAGQKDFVQQLGADMIIDYATTRFETVVRDADLVIDTLGGEPRDRSWQVLRTGGTLITLPGPLPKSLPRQDVRGAFFIVRPDSDQLARISELIDMSVIKPTLQATIPLSDGAKAFELGLKGHLRGKIVIAVAS